VGQADDPGRGRHSASPVPPPAPPALPDGPAPPEVPPRVDAAPGAAAVPGRHRASGSLDRVRAIGRWPLVGFAVLVVAVVVAVTVAVTTASRGTDHRTDAGPASAQDLAAWATAQLPPGATLSADPSATVELAQAGVEAGMLTTAASEAGAADRPALQVVRGADVGDSTVVARFPDAAGGELTVIDPAAVPPDPAQLERRRQLGAALLANPLTRAPVDAAQRLRDGQVDPRLLTLLAGMAARFGTQLAELPLAAGEPVGASARAAVVSAVDGRPVAEGTTELAGLRSYLAAQLATFSPDEVQLVDGGLLVRFRYITDPDGAVTRGGG